MALVARRWESLVLLSGDLVCFGLGLWLALYLRYLEVPSATLWLAHAVPFSILSLLWLGVFFIAGLYEKHTVLFKRRLAVILFSAQIGNAAIAVAFFYAGPSFGVNPKTTLFLYFLVSSALLFLWRLYGPELRVLRSRARAVLIGDSEDIRELAREVNSNNRYSFHFDFVLPAAEGAVREALRAGKVEMVVADFQDQQVASLVERVLKATGLSPRLVDAAKLFEDIFDRVPLTLLKSNWRVEQVREVSSWYVAVRRIFDLSLSLVLGLISLVCYPFIYLAIKLEDGGSIFIFQERVGRDGRLVRLTKFRSMSGNDDGRYGATGTSKLFVTRVGKFLRATRLDELPQLWNIFSGKLSLIGPRPELPSLVKVYEESISYYGLRHLLTPGLSGWAQIYHHKHPHHSTDMEETRRKLSYDLYYLKNRSLALDLKIALKTLKTLLSSSGA